MAADTVLVNVDTVEKSVWDGIVAAGTAEKLPIVNETDNGKVLGVNSGKWDKVDAPSSLPTVTSTDNGKLLGVSGGAWGAVDAPKELPSITNADIGKVLGVKNLSGGWQKMSLPAGVTYFQFASAIENEAWVITVKDSDYTGFSNAIKDKVPFFILIEDPSDSKTRYILPCVSLTYTSTYVYKAYFSGYIYKDDAWKVAQVAMENFPEGTVTLVTPAVAT